MEIGSRIRRARDAAGMTQTELANAVQVTRGLVGQWESHRKKPGRDVLIRISEVTSVSVGYLLGHTADINSDIGDLRPREVKLIRGYRQMSERQQDRLAEFVDEAVAGRREVEKQRSPTKGEPVA